jgi:23S rRNA (guanine745-N1)-methyltransferase
VADVWSCIPVAQNSVAVGLDVFAPRNPRELRRTLRDDGALLVVTSAPSHLAELRQPLRLLDVDRHKKERLAHALAPFFRCHVQESLSWRMELNRDDVISLAAMLPSARHTDTERVAHRAAMLSFPTSVTGSVMLRIYRPV